MRRRDYKNFSEKSIFHIYNRGNNKEKIFFDEKDYKAFLFRIALILGLDNKIIKKESDLVITNSRIRLKPYKNCFRLHSFCLMPNHFHLVLEQLTEKPISKFLHSLCTSYSMYINKKYKRVGHIFQSRFKSVKINNNNQLMWISNYIHMNPVKDNLVNKPENYKWSSYLDFIEKRNIPILFKDLFLEIFENKENFIKQNKILSKKSIGLL